MISKENKIGPGKDQPPPLEASSTATSKPSSSSTTPLLGPSTRSTGKTSQVAPIHGVLCITEFKATLSHTDLASALTTRLAYTFEGKGKSKDKGKGYKLGSGIAFGTKFGSRVSGAIEGA